jgi:methyl-accepting chemotaxis protein
VQVTAEKIAQIASSTTEQATTAQEVGQAICNVTQGTEHVAAGSEELASSSEQLGAQAANLRQLVQRFKVQADAAKTRLGGEYAAAESTFAGSLAQ